MSEHLEKLLADTAALREPLAGDSPVGTDIALEEEFEAIKNEIEKLSSIDGGTPNWKEVRKNSDDLLTNRTKDLRLAVWSAAAAGELEGWNGLARALVVIRSLITDFWETAFPARAKARVNNIAWLAERTQPIIENLPIGSFEEGDDVRAVNELMKEIDREMGERAGDAFQGIRGAMNAAKNRVRDIPEPPPPPPPEPEPEPEPEPTPEPEPQAYEPPPQEASSDADPWLVQDEAPAAPAPSYGGGGVTLSTEASDAEETTKTIREALVALARSITQQDQGRAWAYALHRSGIWLGFDQIPAESSPPDESLRERLATLLATNRWSELAVAGEEASALHPTWLDPHRFVALALERLGTSFNEAREVVGRMTSDFVRRYGSRLIDGRFTDDSAFATIETIAWADEESKRWLSLVEYTAPGSREERELSARYREARQLVQSGRPVSGLQLAMKLARRADDPRARFRASLDVARMACSVRAEEIARPILQTLMATAEKHDLETWEPTLASLLNETICRAFPGESAERDRALESLCRIDPGRALLVQRGPRPAAAAPRMAAPSNYDEQPSYGGGGGGGRAADSDAHRSASEPEADPFMVSDEPSAPEEESNFDPWLVE